MDLISCTVRLAGDLYSTTVRGPDDPVSWPEVGLLQRIHGEHAVVDCRVVRKVDSTAAEEKERLKQIYDEHLVEAVYPGRTPMMALEMPGGDVEPPKPRKAKHFRFDPTMNTQIAPPAAPPDLPKE